MIESRIKFRHLRTIMEVARQKSVVKASEILNVSQPATTKTIRELEEILGVPVVERDGRGIKITRFGEVFLQYAGTILTALRQGVDSVSQELDGSGELIRIGALPTVSTRIMPNAINLFLAEKTRSRVKIVTGENAVLLEQLRVGDLDLVVGRLAASEKMLGFSFEHLYSEQVRFVVRKGHPLTKKQSVFDHIADYPILMPTQNSIIRPFVERLLIANGVGILPVQIETVSDSFGREILRETDAIWIISEGVIDRDVKEGRLAILEIDTSETTGPVGLTMRTDMVQTTAVRIIIQTIREAARLKTNQY